MAAKFHVTERTIDNWRTRFRMPHYVLGRRVMFKLSEVDAWMKTLRRGALVAATG